MCNHRTLIDPLVLGAVMHAYPLSKAEVGKYPLLGKAAKYTGIILVNRENKGSRSAALQAIADHLKKEISVLIFPEGTTSDLPTTQPFKPGVFKLAAELKIPVCPIAVIYTDRRHHWTHGSLLDHFLARFGEKRTDVQVHFGESSVFSDADQARHTTRAWINTQILSVT